MPFATLPSSPGFQAPQAPDWTRFASQAVDLIAHQPIPDTAGLVNQAVQQINQVLKLQSPEARLERDLHIQQLKTMQSIYQDYKLHPDEYVMTAHGPVKEDPITRIGKLATIKHTMASTDWLNKRTGQGTPSFISDAMKKMQAAINAEKQGVTLPSSKIAPATANTDTTASDTSSTPEENAAVDAEALSSGYNKLQQNSILDNPFGNE